MSVVAATLSPAASNGAWRVSKNINRFFLSREQVIRRPEFRREITVPDLGT